MDIHSKYYITKPYGGFSPCIQGNPKFGLRPFPGSVLPNCVGYAVGRFNELAGEGSCKYLGNRNAAELYDLGISQGLSGGSAPRPGALIVWRTSGAGHCAIVERVVDENNMITTESGWNYYTEPIVRTVQRRKTAGSWDYPGGTCLGFIYQPEEEDIMKTFDAYKSGEAVKDPEVLRLQILLNGLQGSRLTKDSYYGPATTKAVAKWQADHKIEATGTCDQQTWNSILGKG
ncbi:MAG: peptidoglycan-binding protein [Spirochaetia bacterium]|nr:peptidoglycan-binding protein [Spirochaetia bacterium]